MDIGKFLNYVSVVHFRKKLVARKNFDDAFRKMDTELSAQNLIIGSSNNMF